MSDSATPWTTACQASLPFTISQSLLKLMSIPLLLPPSVFHNIRVFSNESALHIRWPKYWSFNFSISPSNEYSGLVSFRVLVWSPSWRRKWQPTPVLLPGESHGQREPGGLQSVGLQRVGHDWATFTSRHIDLLVVQRTLERLLQHHSSEASVVSCSTFLILCLGLS